MLKASTRSWELCVSTMLSSRKRQLDVDQFFSMEPDIKVDGTSIKVADEAKFLGLVFDRRL